MKDIGPIDNTDVGPYLRDKLSQTVQESCDPVPDEYAVRLLKWHGASGAIKQLRLAIESEPCPSAEEARKWKECLWLLRQAEDSAPE